VISDPFLELNVIEVPFGEEPIDSLQNLFDEWLLTSTEEELVSRPMVKVFPNPAKEELVFELLSNENLNGYEMELYDLRGKSVLNQTISGPVHVLNRRDLPASSMFIYRVYNQQKVLLQSGKILFVD